MPGNDPQLYLAGLAAHSQGRTDTRAPLVFLHGLTYDRRHWQPVLDELAVLDPDRRIVTLDLPGHGGSPVPDSYRFEAVVATIRQAVNEAELEAPVLVGHSLGAVLATGYAAAHPARGVVNLDQPLVLGGFGSFLQQVEPVLRGPGFADIWDRLVANMHPELLPPSAQELLRTNTVRQDLLLGCWADIFTDPDALDARRREDLRRIAAQGIAYHHVAGQEIGPEYRRWMQALVPTVSFTVLPDSGHFPHLAHPRAVAEILSLVGLHKGTPLL